VNRFESHVAAFYGMGDCFVCVWARMAECSNGGEGSGDARDAGEVGALVQVTTGDSHMRGGRCKDDLVAIDLDLHGARGG
jgi:hypothetical protein